MPGQLTADEKLNTLLAAVSQVLETAENGLSTCRWCGQESYPVDKDGKNIWTDESAGEEVEFQLDHAPDCAVSLIEKAMAEIYPGTVAAPAASTATFYLIYRDEGPGLGVYADTNDWERPWMLLHVFTDLAALNDWVAHFRANPPNRRQARLEGPIIDDTGAQTVFRH